MCMVLVAQIKSFQIIGNTVLLPAVKLLYKTYIHTNKTLNAFVAYYSLNCNSTL